MKTKVEINDFEINIEEVAGKITVTAKDMGKGGEVVEEFTLSGSDTETETDEFDEEGTEGGSMSQPNTEIKGFDEFEEEQDFSSPMPEDSEGDDDTYETEDEDEFEPEVSDATDTGDDTETEDDDDDTETDDDDDDDDDDDESQDETETEDEKSPALESFQSFINKSKKKRKK